MGDCGLTQSIQAFPSISLSSSFLTLSSLDTYATSEDKAPLLLVVPKMTITAFHINMSDVLFGLSENGRVELDEMLYTEYIYNRKNHSKNGSGSITEEFVVQEIESGTGVVHIATISRQLGLLTVLLRSEESSEITQKLPVDIYFTLKIRIINTTAAVIDSYPPETEVLANTSSLIDDSMDLLSDSATIFDGRSHRTQLSFRVRIGAIDESEAIDPRFGESPITTYTNSVCEGSDIQARIIPYPQISNKFRLGHVDATNLNSSDETEIILLELNIESSTSIEHMHLQDLELLATYSLINGSQALYQFNMCDIIDSPQFSCGLSLAELVEQRRTSSIEHWKSSYIRSRKMSHATFRGLNRSAYAAMDGGFYVLADNYFKEKVMAAEIEKDAAKIVVLLPVPVKFNDFQSSWLQLQVKLAPMSQQASAFPLNEMPGQACWSSLISWGGKPPLNSTIITTADFKSFTNSTNTTIDNANDYISASRRLTLRKQEKFHESLTNDDVFEIFSKFVDVGAAFSSIGSDDNRLYRTHKNLENSSAGGRRLEDTYASSLLFVNRLLNKEFGNEQRKVPAHLPHLIDVEIMEEMQIRWRNLWSNTSSHRFRSPNDMQYAFAYYHYVIHRYEAHEPDLAAFLHNEIDTNGDGFVDDNEFRTIAAIVRGKILTPEKIWEYKKCALPGLDPVVVSDDYNNTGNDNGTGNVESGQMDTHKFTIKGILNCTVIKTAFLDRMKKEKHYPLIPSTHNLGSEDDVSFEMIYDNATLTEQKLDSIRWRKTKFICLNDNAKEYTPELEMVVQDFFNAMYPTPSAFELPFGQKNPTLYTDQHRFLVTIEFTIICIADIIGALLMVYIVASSIIVFFYSHDDNVDDRGGSISGSTCTQKKGEDKKKHM